MEIRLGLLPNFKRFIFKSVIFYLPVVFIFLKYYQQYWLVGVFASMVLCETLDFSTSLIIKLQRRVIGFLLKILQEKMTFLLSWFGVLILCFIFSKTIDSQISFWGNDIFIIQLHLGFLFSVIGLAIPLFFNLLYQLSKYYPKVVAKEFSNISGLKSFLFYLFLLCVANFYFLTFSKNNLNIDVSFLLFLSASFTVLVLFFVIRDVYKILFLEQGLVQQYSKGVIDFIKKSTPKRILDDREGQWGFLNLNKKEKFLEGIKISVRVRWRMFFYGTFDSKSMPSGDIDKGDFKKLEYKLRPLFRMAQKSIEKDDFIEVKVICHEIAQITKTYIKNTSYFSTDDYTMLFVLESKNLFEVACKQKNEETLEYIVKMVGDSVLEVSNKKRIGMDMPTSTLEKVLVDFCIQGLSKFNSLATNNSILYLGDVGINYAQRGDFEASLHTAGNLAKIGKSFSLFDHIYTLKMCRKLLNQMVKIYFQSKIKVLSSPNSSYLERYTRKIFEDIKEICVNLYEKNSSLSYGQDPANIFFDEFDRINTVHSYLNYIFHDKSVEISEKQSLIYDIEEMTQNIFDISCTATLNKKDNHNYGRFFFRLFELLLNFYSIEEVNDRTREKLLDIFEKQLVPLYSKEAGLVLSESRSHTAIYPLSFLVVGLIIKIKGDKCLLLILEATIKNLISAFDSLDDKNDFCSHKRRNLYSYLLLIAAWCWKHIPDEKITNELIDFTQTNKQHRATHNHLSRTSHFSVSNFPQPEDFFGFSGFFQEKIWSVKKSFFNIEGSTMDEEDYQEFCNFLDGNSSKS